MIMAKRRKIIYVTSKNILQVRAMKGVVLRAFKYTGSNGKSPISIAKPRLLYKAGATVRVPSANRNKWQDCGAGVNVGTACWIKRQAALYHRIWIIEFKPADIACTPVYTSYSLGSKVIMPYEKFRLYKGKVIRQVNRETLTDVKAYN